MVCEQMNKIEAVDMLSTLRQSAAKALCLMWDVTTDFFEPLTQAVDNCEFKTVRMMAEADASIAAMKAEIVADLLVAMADQADQYLEYLKRGAKHDSDTIHGDDGERGGSGGGV